MSFTTASTSVFGHMLEDEAREATARSAGPGPGSDAEQQLRQARRQSVQRHAQHTVDDPMRYIKVFTSGGELQNDHVMAYRNIDGLVPSC